MTCTMSRDISGNTNFDTHPLTEGDIMLRHPKHPKSGPRVFQVPKGSRILRKHQNLGSPGRQGKGYLKPKSMSNTGLLGYI